ncbi:tryptophan halogenase family protein [Maribacter sp. 2-571]|uniref:tryptophan halogenase family protein n=1 Tax=Maribacter sp. 2-571 TaxID=3417569 RepID=UPI003D33624D
MGAFQQTPINGSIEKIIVVGGGSSGAISAAYLSKALGSNVEVQLIESPNISKIGVGEATIPTIKEEVFDFLGIPEEEWMPVCKGTYKTGIRFDNWKRSPTEGGDRYWHAFGELPTVRRVPLSHIWLHNYLDGHHAPMDYTCYSTPLLCDHYKSPKYLDGTKAIHYAYHFDATILADFLIDWSVKHLGITQTFAELVGAERNEEGNVTTVIDTDGNRYEADLFIDCSGFKGFLIQEALEEPIVEFKDSLLTDSAVAVNIPNESGNQDLRPFTSATAMEAGWAWKIPLMERSGNGYVYSSQFKTPEEAQTEMARHLGPEKVKGRDFRHFKFKSFRRRRSWVNNVVSLGLAGAFLEPLESTGLYFVYASLYQLTCYFPGKKINPALRDKFNERVNFMVDDVKDFIILHFCTSGRTDTPFWLANKHDLVIPDPLREILDLQMSAVPVNRSYSSNEGLYDTLDSSFDRFWTNSNYQSILAGVGYLPKESMPLLKVRRDILEEGQKVVDEIRKKTQHHLNNLPSHHEYLSHLYSRQEALSPVE